LASAVQFGVVRAQEPGATALPGAAVAETPRDYGVGNVNVLQIPAPAFQPSLTGNFTFDSNFYLYPGSVGAVYAIAPVQLPSGSKIINVGIFYDDTDAVNDVSVYLLELPGYNASASHNQIGTASSSGSGGKGYASGVVNYTVNNNVRWGSGAQLVAEVYVPTTSTKFKGVDIWWTRQISPAPDTPTFGDVPKNHPFYTTIEAFARAGITSGCGNGNFCPTGAVTRQEIAKFMVRALGLYWPDNVP
jgi:hypothetical protein